LHIKDYPPPGAFPGRLSCTRDLRKGTVIAGVWPNKQECYLKEANDVEGSLFG
jgi:hypothetical protein